MLAFDDHTGNVLTTVALFAIAAAVVYLARGVFFILLLSLLFAYLLEPMVTFAERHSRLGHRSRTWAIAQVYLVATLVVGGLGYALGPHLVGQMKSLKAAVPEILADLSSGRAAATLGGGHLLSAAQQLWIHDWLARHHDFMERAFERGAASAGYVAASGLWLFAVPILAIFFLRDGRRMADAIMERVGPRGEQTLGARILRRVDGMLAKYIRAELVLAGLSFLFYSVSMLVLGFPYAIALGFMGGALEFLPTIGWLISAAIMLTIGFLTHAHWIWMAVLVVVWRLVQAYVNSPRIMGDSLQLQPLTVIVALMVGGQVGGIPGLYISVPAVAVLRIVWLECSSSRNYPVGQSGQPLMQMKG